MRVVRQAVSGFHYKECGTRLAMPAMATPIGHVWNGDTGGTGCMPATSSAQKGTRHSFHPCLGWLFSLARWLRKQSEGHQAASGFPGPWTEQHKPQARGSSKGQHMQGATCRAPCRSARCSSFSSEVSFIQAKIAGWMSK